MTDTCKAQEPENEPKNNKVQAGAKELKREQLKQPCLTGPGGAKGLKVFQSEGADTALKHTSQQEIRL